MRSSISRSAQLQPLYFGFRTGTSLFSALYIVHYWLKKGLPNQIIPLWSRRLSPTERNYTTTEREGLAMILYRSFGISYQIRRKIVYVDHQALQKRGYYWPGMRDDVAEYVKTFLVCQQDKVERDRLLGLLEPQPVPQRPWESISIDALPKKGVWVLIVVDRLTNKICPFLSTVPSIYSSNSRSDLCR